MFKKLRIKFIAITMVMVAVVMAFAFTVVCVVEYQRSYSVVQTTLDNAVQEAIVSTNRSKDRQGMMHPGMRQEPPDASSGNAGSSSSSSSEQGSQAASPLEPEKAYADEPQPGQNGQNARDGQGGDPSRNGQQPYGQNNPNGQNGQNGKDGQIGQNEQNSNAAPGQASGTDQGNGTGSNSGQQPTTPATTDGRNGNEAGANPNTDNSADADSADPGSDEGESSNTVSRQSNSDSDSNSENGSATAWNGSATSSESDQASPNADESNDSVTISDEDMGQTAPPSIGARPGQQRPTSSLVPVAVYRIDSNGTLRVVPEVTTASISEDVLQEAADLALQGEAGFGTFANLGLHYYKTENDGTTYLAFADTSYTDSWQTLAMIFAGSGAGTLAVFFVVALFYSRWALRPVKEAWDSQRQFVADASHDLKTPLTVILANAAILLKHPDHTIASESQWIESTQKEAEDMQGLVNEMLELAQIEAGQKIDAVRDPIDLSDLVDGETLLFDSVALERNCQFNCSIDEGVQILGDEKQVKKLVSTLVENAFKYVDESGTIDIVMRKNGKMATIDIHNTGSTISVEDLPHIFDRFYRTDKARTSGTGGFGLGLAIAREIARQHDGDITCKSTEEDGTTFTITLPVSQ